MSFIPGGDPLRRESLRSREVEAERVTRDYEHTHPQAEYGLPKRPSLFRRVLQKLRGKTPSE